MKTIKVSKEEYFEPFLHSLGKDVDEMLITNTILLTKRLMQEFPGEEIRIQYSDKHKSSVA